MSKQSKPPQVPTEFLAVKLSALAAWKDNYNEGDVGAIAISIERFGFNGALRVWRDGIVIGGNHSLMALMSLKARGPNGRSKWPPEHIVEAADGEWLIPCVDISHLDELDAKAFAIADNDIARKATQDAARKAQYLIELQHDRPESLKAAGWTPEALDEFLASMSSELAGEDEEVFDATKLEDAYMPDASLVPPGTYIIYVSFDNREDFERFLRIVDPGRPVELAKQYASVASQLVMSHLQDDTTQEQVSGQPSEREDEF